MALHGMRLNDSSLFAQSFFLFACAISLWCSPSQAQQSDKAPTELPDAPHPTVTDTKGFFARLVAFYRQDWSPPNPSPTTSGPPARRGLSSPLDSPPFPNEDWSYGGSPVIGEPDTNSYPLMTGINEARSRAKLYGWIEPTVDFSTSRSQTEPPANPT